MKTIGFYAGSFDPFTNGHLHIVKKALKLFDSLIIGIAYNPDKGQRRFDSSSMVDAITQTLRDEGLEDRTKVIHYTGLTYDVARNENATHLIRGLRNGMDYAYEEDLALANEHFGNYDTIYLRSEPNFYHISSSIIMQLYYNGKDVSKHVPPAVYHAMNK